MEIVHADKYLIKTEIKINTFAGTKGVCWDSKKIQNGLVTEQAYVDISKVDLSHKIRRWDSSSDVKINLNWKIKVFRVMLKST